MKVTFRQDKYFLTFLPFCEFLSSGLLARIHFIAVKMFSNISWLFCLINALDHSVKVTFRQDKYFLTFLPFCEFLASGLLARVYFIAVKLSSNTQRTSKDKPKSVKCQHFCIPFDSHNYCPSCREANKGDDPCVTLESPCEICASFWDEQMNKIKNRKRYVRTKKANRSLGQEALLLCSHSVLTSKMLLTTLNMTFRPLTYLRVNILNLPPLQNGTRWDSLVMKTKSRS